MTAPAGRLYGVIGAGGFGREVIHLLRMQIAEELRSGRASVTFVVEPPLENPSVGGVPVIPLQDFLRHDGERLFIIAIARSDARARIAALCEHAGALPVSVDAGGIARYPGVSIGPGAILAPFTAITSDAQVGRYFHLNIHGYVAHDCRIGDFVTFAPSVICNGHVRIGDHAYVGAGATIRNGTQTEPMLIGAGAVVGMGAVVVRPVPPGVTVVGNPARIIARR